MTEIIQELTVVIPAYNEEERIGASLADVFTYLEQHVTDFEVIVVDDGSCDSTAALTASLFSSRSGGRLIRLPQNRGKGAAVRTGILEATKGSVLVSDADFSTPIREVKKLHQYLDQYDVVIGSRMADGAELLRQQTWTRRSMGKIFNSLMRGMGLTGYRDTQCGFKLWRTPAARKVFNVGQVDGFAFDVEALLVAEQLGYRIREVGVRWSNSPQSKVRIIKDSLTMFKDALQIYWRIHRRR